MATMTDYTAISEAYVDESDLEDAEAYALIVGAGADRLTWALAVIDQDLEALYAMRRSERSRSLAGHIDYVETYRTYLLSELAQA